MSIPSRNSDSDVGKTLLEDTSAETSSRGSSEAGEIRTPKPSSNSRFYQGWLFFTTLNVLLLVASLVIRKSDWSRSERQSCLKETSYFCMSYPPNVKIV
jgi:hypothetical protein